MEVHEHNPERRFVIWNDIYPSPDASSPGSSIKAAVTQSKAACDGTDPRGRHATREVGFESKRERQRVCANIGAERSSRPGPPTLTLDRQHYPQPTHRRSRSAASTRRHDHLDIFLTSPASCVDHMLAPGTLAFDRSEWGGLPLGGRDSNSKPQPQSPAWQSRLGFKDQRFHSELSKKDAFRTGSSKPKFETSITATGQRPVNWYDSFERHQGGSPTADGRAVNQRPYGPNQGAKVTSSVPAMPRVASRSYADSHSDGFQRPVASPSFEAKPMATVAFRLPRTGSDRDANSYPLPRGDRSPLPSPSTQTMTASPTSSPRSTAAPTISKSGQGLQHNAKIPLPYPEDDCYFHQNFPMALDGAEVPYRSVAGPVEAMPEPSRSSPTTPEQCNQMMIISPTKFTPSQTHSSFEAPMLDPIVEAERFSAVHARNDVGRNSRGLPDCPRTTPVAGMSDWLTVAQTDLNICPSCFHAVFARSKLRYQFQPRARPPDKPVSCDFGSSPWYRIAWLLTLKRVIPDLRLFYQVSRVAASSPNLPCPGNRLAARVWLTIKNPRTARPVPDFAVCYRCAKTVEALLPSLRGIFVLFNFRTEPRRGICALHFAPRRRQFVFYFDALESVADRSRTALKTSHYAELALELQRLSTGSECSRDSPVYSGLWHTMHSLPEFTVCGACFDEVVRPRIGNGAVIARDFLASPRRLPWATCQLYSERMREVFGKACRRRDGRYLREKVLQRRRIEDDITERLMKLDRSPKNYDWTLEEQAEKLVREWMRWE